MPDPININQISNYQPSANSMDGKTILITGAAGGLGSALAKACAGLKAELILLDNNQNKLNQLHDEIETEFATQPGLYPLDMRGAGPDDYAQLAQTVKDTFGGLHGLVHCAANLGQVSPIDSMQAKLWHETFAINLHAPMLLTQTVLPLMRDTGSARIIFSTDTKLTAYWGAYGISKASLIAAMHIIADELDTNTLPLPVTCNAINPGPMRTNLRSSAYPGEKPNTIAAAEDKTAAYLYLLSSEAQHINGVHIEL